MLHVLIPIPLLLACGPREPVALSMQVGPEDVPVVPTRPPVAETLPAVGTPPPESAAPAQVVDLAVEPTVEPGGTEPRRIQVRPGENLVLVARWSGVPAERIAELSGIGVRDTLHPGDVLVLPVDEAGFQAVQAARERYEDERLDAFLASRGGLVGVDTHAVATGETAWSVARDEGGLPLWVLAAFNRELDLDHLGIGEELYLPITGSRVDRETAENACDELEVEPPVEGASRALP